MEGLVQDFLRFLEVDKKVSRNTYESYRRDVNQFKAFMVENKIMIENVNNRDILMYLRYLNDNKKSVATISRSLATLKSFFQYLDRTNKIKEDPTVGIQSPKSEKKSPNILSSDEINLLLDQPKNVDLKGIRDKAMLELAYATGMRVTEIISLNIEDVNLNQEYVVCKSVNKERTIPLGTLSVKALKDYITNARDILIKKDSTNSLFVNINGKRLTRQGFWKIIKYYKEQAHIDKDITPHVLRHSFAVHLLQNGADLRSISTLLGHSDIASTQVYMKFQDTGLQDMYKKAHPRA